MAKTFELIPEQLLTQQIPFICIKDYKITSQSGTPRDNDSIGTQRGDYEWWFVCPNEVIEDTTHTWEEYESMATRLAQKMADIHHGWTQTKQMGGNIANIAMNDNSPRNRGNWLESQAHHIVGTDLAGSLNYRVDSALMYKNSARRSITFSFQLADFFIKGSDESNTGYGSEIIYNAIRKLQELSCPEYTGDIYKLNFPHIFEVYTTGQDAYQTPMISMKTAALTAVQPTWKMPFTGGTFDTIYPSQVDLQLTFTDLKPLFRHNFNTGGIVETS